MPLVLYHLRGRHTHFLNQARASQRPVCAWFLEIAFVHEVSMLVYVRVCVCVRPQGYK